MTQKYVIKNNGKKEAWSDEKINQVCIWACAGTDACPSEIAMQAKIKYFDGITTQDIHEALYKSAADLVEEYEPDFAIAAARLRLFNIRKRAYGDFNPPELYEHVREVTELGWYDPEIIQKWSEDDFRELDNYIDHNRDLDYKYAAITQWDKKYLVQNRVTGEIFESPQMAIMLCGMCLHQDEPVDKRIQYVKDFYDEVSLQRISLPTPINAGVRTPSRQFSSCFPAGQKVYTRDGLVSIEDVVEGEEVLTKGGTFEKVILNSSKVSSAKNFVSIRNQFSIPWDFESTSDHRIMAIKKKHPDSRKNYDVPEWVSADKLQVGDFVKIPFNRHVLNRRYIDVPVPNGYSIDAGFIKKSTTDYRARSGYFDDKVTPVPERVEITPQFMRVLGYFLAEGHVNKNKNSIVFTFSVKEQEYHEDVTSYFNTLGLACNSYNTDKNATYLTVCSLPIKQLFLELVGTGFDKKIINDDIMRVRPDLQKELLIGVIRGDGCVHKSGMTLGMCNRTLVHQLGLICLRNGLYPSLGYKEIKGSDKSYGINDVYILNLSKGANYDFIKSVGKSTDKLDSFKIKGNAYGLAKYHNGDYYAKVLEIKVRPNEQETVYDLSVDNDHSFTVSGVGVHNCTLIEMGDSLDSINGVNNAVVKYAANRAGIGVNVGAIRGEKFPIRGGEARHTGLVGVIQHLQAALWPSQGGVRKGSANLFYPWWHYDVEQLIVLKNNRGTEDTRARHLDYGIQFNKVFYERVKNKQPLYLFSPNERSQQLYESFFGDQERFKELYEELIKDNRVVKKVIDSSKFADIFCQERAQTGRIYVQNVDHCNSNSPFNVVLKMSNLCMEVCLPTSPLDANNPNEGEIALCTLAAFNLGLVDDFKQLEKSSKVIVRALDNLLDYQGYPVKAAEKNKLRRTLGVGVINFAYALAKRGLKYSDGSANNFTHELFEALQFYLLKSSKELAEEKGKCELFNETSYSDGVLPIDRYKKEIDNYHTAELNMDWEWLRGEIKQHGLRNSTLTAIMPAETSAQISNATNGIEPPRGAKSVKDDADGKLPQLVPDVEKLFDKYEYKWDQPDCRGYLTLVGIMQKWIDQSISANTQYDPSKYDGGRIPTSVIMKDVMFAYYLGVKTLYYHETRDGNDQEDSGCSGGGCKI